jgi:hypothetical protein
MAVRFLGSSRLYANSQTSILLLVFDLEVKALLISLLSVECVTQVSFRSPGVFEEQSAYAAVPFSLVKPDATA